MWSFWCPIFDRSLPSLNPKVVFNGFNVIQQEPTPVTKFSTNEGSGSKNILRKMGEMSTGTIRRRILR